MVWRWRRYVDVGKLADEVFVCWDFQEKRFVKLSPFPLGSVDKDGNVIRGVLVDNGDGGRSVSDDVVARAKARLKQRRKRLITVIVVWFALLVICLQLGPSHFTLSHGTEPAILLVSCLVGRLASWSLCAPRFFHVYVMDASPREVAMASQQYALFYIMGFPVIHLPLLIDLWGMALGMAIVMGLLPMKIPFLLQILLGCCFLYIASSLVALFMPDGVRERVELRKTERMRKRMAKEGNR